MERKVTVLFLPASASPHPPTIAFQGALYLAGNITNFSLLHSAMPFICNTIPYQSYETPWKKALGTGQ
jgi:hypothetical protein